MTWADHWHVQEKKVYVEKTLSKGLLRRPNNRWEDNIKMDLIK
jgi:hypothetical protein